MFNNSPFKTNCLSELFRDNKVSSSQQDVTTWWKTIPYVPTIPSHSSALVLSGSTTKPTQWSMRPAKTQKISLGFLTPVFSQGILGSDWVDVQADLSLRWAYSSSALWLSRSTTQTRVFIYIHFGHRITKCLYLIECWTGILYGLWW